MSVRLSLRARVELGLYRAVAHLYRASIAIRLALPCDPVRRRCLQERLGRWNGRKETGGAIWVHAASLGEVLTVSPLLERMKAGGAGRIVVTTHTLTGHAAAERTVADEVHCFPVDTPAAVRRVIDVMRPHAFLFVETEIWPSLLLVLAEAGVACFMVNATVSPRSFSRYRRVRSVVSAALATVAGVCARDAGSMRRLMELGARADRAIVSGDLKSDAFDATAYAAIPDHLVGAGAQVLVTASTHEAEDETGLAAHASVRRGHPRARLVLAPRHPERAHRVFAAARASGLSTKLRSRVENDRAARTAAGVAEWDVLVVDTTGELRGFMKSAAAVFVGGSLVAIGGHNLFEPAAFGHGVATGPHLDGVREQADALLRRDALTIVADAEALATYWARCLDHPLETSRTGRAAQAAVRDSAGALERTMRVLAPVLRLGEQEQVAVCRS